MAKKRNPQNSLTMTAQEFLDRISKLRDAWQGETKNETNQTRLFQAGESFISAMDEALDLAGAHPNPPPPRIRP